jgi:Zn ribbon nucleic-acid-binding protein
VFGFSKLEKAWEHHDDMWLWRHEIIVECLSCGCPMAEVGTSWRQCLDAMSRRQASEVKFHRDHPESLPSWIGGPGGVSRV